MKYEFGQVPPHLVTPPLPVQSESIDIGYAQHGVTPAGKTYRYKSLCQYGRCPDA